jgi:hypothetical protein
MRSSYFHGVGLDRVPPDLSELLPQPPIDGLARHGRRGCLRSFGRRPEMGIVFLRVIVMPWIYASGSCKRIMAGDEGPLAGGILRMLGLNDPP